MDELFEVLTLVQTDKIQKIPIVLFGSEFWSGLKGWIENTMLDIHGNISPGDMDLIPMVDSPREAVDMICRFYDVEHTGELEPNYSL